MNGLAIYAGSFDPVTYGHLDLIERTTQHFSRLIVAVARNLGKEPLFSLEQRLFFLRENLKKFSNVQVDSFSGLLVDYAIERKAKILIRGLRAVSDFEYEFQMALTNRKLNASIETIFLMPSESYSYITSGIIKEVAFLNGDVSNFVPPVVAEALQTMVKGKK